MPKSIRLKVAEAIQEDVNKGIVRIDTSFLKQIDVRPGSIVEIKGERTTVGIADRALPGDMGLNIIRTDPLIRRNAKTSIGEFVTVRKADVKEAKSVTIAPAREGLMIRANPAVFKQGLLGRAVVKGDLVSLGGTRRRRSTMMGHPFFDEMFSMLNETTLGFGLGELKFVVVNCEPKQAVLITENTEVIVNPKAVEVAEEKAIDVTYEDIGGLDNELKKVREMIELPLKHPEIFERLGIEAPKGVLLHGPPGTGKTLLAKAVANETNANFLLINGPEIMSKYYGQSEENLRKKFEEAEKNAPSIIFIDEIDAIASKREESRGEVERRVVAQLLALMDGLQARGKVIVIAATNIPNVLDPALRRPGRFDREIEIGVPNEQGRLAILKIHTRNMPLDKSVSLEKLAQITHGFVGADLASLAKEAAMTVLRRVLGDTQLKEGEPIPQEILEKLVLTQQDFKEALKVVRPSALREVLIEIPNVKWEDIGGLQSVKQELIEAVEWPLKHKADFKRLGVKPPKGVLLYGAPGT
ncbi:MAG TPA: AAA family ATPase, partial [Candidatus Woesearchaeota archaeon]|nr:AAA family ATPase [Candidatus Woesearchaeota archaeon]